MRIATGKYTRMKTNGQSQTPAVNDFIEKSASCQESFLVRAVLLSFLLCPYPRSFLPRGSIDARHDHSSLAHEDRHLSTMVDLMSDE